jgi:hypothetical protein
MVKISPDEVTSMPVPAPDAVWYDSVVSMSTRLASTLVAMAATVGEAAGLEIGSEVGGAVGGVVERNTP